MEIIKMRIEEAGTGTFLEAHSHLEFLAAIGALHQDAWAFDVYAHHKIFVENMSRSDALGIVDQIKQAYQDARGNGHE